MSNGDVEALIQEAEDFVLEPAGLKTITLTELMAKTFQPIKWIVPDLLPEGLTLLAGSSKIGKSWLALSLCQTVAFGGFAINQQRVEQGEVLYLALEDSERRLQERFEMICREGAQESELLHFATKIERADQGGFEYLIAWLDQHPHCRLVVIDTLQRFRERSAGGRETYGSDYEAMIPLQSLAIQRGISVILIHHTRKADASDPFDKINGTTALMGASDCTWLLERARGEADGKLHITGRDVEEHELALRFDAVDCHWSVLGDAETVAASKEEREILDLLKNSADPFSPKEVVEELGIGDSAAKMRLRRMAQSGKIVKAERGKYTHPDNLKSGSHTEGHKVTSGHNNHVTAEKQTIIAFPSQSHKVTSAPGDSEKPIDYAASKNPASQCDSVTLQRKPLPVLENKSHTPSVTECDDVTSQVPDPSIEGSI